MLRACNYSICVSGVEDHDISEISKLEQNEISLGFKISDLTDDLKK